MPGGRPPQGPSLVDRLEGPEVAKQRLKAILEVLSREKTVEEACAALGIERARFYTLQREALVGALLGVTPEPPGRKPCALPSPVAERVRTLEQEVTDLKLTAHAAEIRAEVAEVFPNLVQKTRRAGEKKVRARKPW
jgi:transposase-like protein